MAGAKDELGSSRSSQRISANCSGVISVSKGWMGVAGGRGINSRILTM